MVLGHIITISDDDAYKIQHRKYPKSYVLKGVVLIDIYLFIVNQQTPDVNLKHREGKSFPVLKNRLPGERITFMFTNIPISNSQRRWNNMGRKLS